MAIEGEKARRAGAKRRDGERTAHVLIPLIPAKAGTQAFLLFEQKPPTPPTRANSATQNPWVPAFAGMSGTGWRAHPSGCLPTLKAMASPACLRSLVKDGAPAPPPRGGPPGPP